MYVQERPGGPGTQVLTMRRFLIAILSLAALPAIASAQRGGMGAGMGHAAVSAPHASISAHSAPSGAAHISSGARATSATNYGVRPPSGMHWVRTRSGAIVARPMQRTTSPVQRAGSGRQLLSQDIVPGLGFDYAHVAAVHPNANNGRNRNGRFIGAYFPFYGGGYYLPLFPDDTDEAPAAEAQAADNGQPEPSQPALRPGDYDSRQNRPPVPSRDVVAEDQPEPYVFVRRDGTLFFATAYAWENNTLRYITAEGLRRTVTADKLDLNATQQFNEQRGLSFRVPAA
jgi:hypothetical protein